MVYVDHSLYVCMRDKGNIIITMYIDDLIVVGHNEEEVENVNSLLKMHDLGELQCFLGIEMIRMP